MHQTEKDSQLFTSIITLISKENKVLLLKRGLEAPYMPGKWSLPGGESEAAETALEAIKREVLEETNIVLEAPEFVKSLLIDNYKIFLFKTIVDQQEVILDTENDEYYWFDNEQIKQMEIDHKIIPGLAQHILDVIS